MLRTDSNTGITLRHTTTRSDATSSRAGIPEEGNLEPVCRTLVIENMRPRGG